MTPFPARSYLQLAKVLQDSGNTNDALGVRVRMEELRRSTEEHGLFARPWSLLLKGSIGYGYDPARAIWEIMGLSALGWIIYRRSYLAGGVAPTDKEACRDFKAGGQASAAYPAFSPLIYSVENSLPLVKLGQADKWQPDPEPKVSSPLNAPAPKLGHRGTWAQPPDKLQSAGQSFLRGLTAIWCRVPTGLRNACMWISSKLERFLVQFGLQPETESRRSALFLSRSATSPRFVKWFLWIQVLLGWLLATLFVAGVSGIVHKE